MPHTSTERLSGVLSVDALRQLVDTIAAFPATTSERGRRYAAQGRVRDLQLGDTLITAVVRGTEIYEAAWDWNGRRWTPDCTCPIAPWCKHAYATACCALAAARDQQFTDPRLAKLLPPIVATQQALPNTAALNSGPPARQSKPDPAVGQLRKASSIYQRQYALDRLLAGAPAHGLSPYSSPFSEIVQEPDPDMLCWRLAREIAPRAGGWLPRGLEPYRERPDLERQHTQRIQQALEQQLIQWAEQQRPGVQRQLRIVFYLDQNPDGAGLRIEARVTTPRVNDAPRSMAQLRQLQTEVRRTPGLLPAEQLPVLDWVAQHGLGGNTSYGISPETLIRGLLERLADRPIASWSPDLPPELAARAGIEPGGVVRLRRDPARLVPMCVSRDGETYVELRFQWPDRDRGIHEVLYFRPQHHWGTPEPSLVLADGEFSTVIGEPSHALWQLFASAGGLRVPPESRTATLQRLAAGFPHFQDTLSAHTHYHAATAVIALDLRDDDWLQLRLFARTSSDWQPGTAIASDAIVFEYTPDRGWMRQETAPSSNAALAYQGMASQGAATAGDPAAVPATTDAAPAAATDETWLDAPTPESVDPGLSWLMSLRAGPGTRKTPGGHQPTWEDRTVGWWLRASRATLMTLADAWEQRPDGVAFYGTERIRRLLGGTERVAPKIRIASSGVDWFAVSTEWAAEGMELSDADLAKLRASATRFVKLSSGWVRRDAAEVHDEAMELFADLGLDPGAGEQRLTVWQLAGAKTESLKALERLGADRETIAAVQRLRQQVATFTGLPSIPMPQGVTAELRPYQLRGLDFLVYTSSFGIGAVLADDMGLGKTVQALAWLTHLQTEDPDGGPSLVVCPASVVDNWAREAAHFTPGMRVLLLTSGKTRHELRREIPDHDLIVTNYALLRRDIEQWEKLPLRALILDEAQNIKNPDAVVTRAAQAMQARYRLALTGTPLENRALDLWSILNVVSPGYLGNRAQFQTRFDSLDAPPHSRTLLAAKLRPVLLRRTKREVAPDLPERIEERIDCELTKEQRQLYLAELVKSRRLVEQLGAEPDGVARNKITILAALTRLRQICCHPALAGGKAGLGSGKFDALFELLEPLLAEGHKVLVFSQFVQCLKLLSAELRQRGMVFHTLTGQTTKRQQVVDAFQSDPQACVFLISLRAGGTGLNLTAASYVVVFDPWWNPAVEAQAIDRTHRIGQDRTVIAYRLLTKGTIEEKIWDLQQQKAELARDLLGEGGFARALTKSDLEYLLAEV